MAQNDIQAWLIALYQLIFGMSYSAIMKEVLESVSQPRPQYFDALAAAGATLLERLKRAQVAPTLTP